MDNGMDYYGGQAMYNADIPAYNADMPEYGSDGAYADPDAPPVELPPEPEDSPYEDPIVRHILSMKDDTYRRRMLSYLHENVRPRTNLHPLTVTLALILCFPVGLCMMYFGTQWGMFAKVVITVFTLLMALAVYEILVLGGTLSTPSLIDTVGYLVGQLSEI